MHFSGSETRRGGIGVRRGDLADQAIGLHSWGFKAQILLNAYSDFLPKAVGQRGQAAARLVRGDALDAMHGVEDRRHARRDLFLVQELPDEIIK